ncbi:hypothetical protein [Cochlodiniinecator piscidefendens]|uniref:hypothetical protein n=1 Tax=Cochlodiniinecator piscidefendens TaxID=2715756 RepID=UPI00140A0F6D|nr:hypothetical protein [Cochlodiniinecator piscidefendens]
MFVIVGILIGAFWGASKAKKRGGNRLDIIQYAAIHAILLAILGLFVTIVIERML